jgi:hypothetical protein
MTRRNSRRAISPIGDQTARRIRQKGAVAHYDAGYRLTNDGSTTTWVDRIGGYSAASTSVGTNPAVTASIAAFNGRPGLTFTASSSQKLISSDGVLATLMSGNQPYTIFIVRKNTTNSGFMATLNFGDTVTNHYIACASLTNGQMYAGRKGPDGTDATGSVQPTTTACLDTYVWDGTYFTGNESGVASIAQTVGGGAAQSPSVNRLAIGGFLSAGAYSDFFDGVIGDIVIFRSALNAGDISYVERILAQKYRWSW